LARDRIKKLLQQPKPLLLHILTPLRGEAVPRLNVRTLATIGGVLDHVREVENGYAFYVTAALISLRLYKTDRLSKRSFSATSTDALDEP
jgi:hypothetical protein